MLVCRHEAIVAAPVESVWDLVGDPRRYPEWWPSVIEVQGRQFGRGCSYCQVSKESGRASEKTFLVERLEEGREILVRCRETGLYMRWLLTPMQDATFIDGEFGLDPDLAGRGDPDFDPDAHRRELRDWLTASLDALGEAAVPSGTGSS